MILRKKRGNLVRRIRKIITATRVNKSSFGAMGARVGRHYRGPGVLNIKAITRNRIINRETKKRVFFSQSYAYNARRVW